MICHTRCRARSFSGDAHCTNMTHSLLATSLSKCFVETTEYIKYNKHQDIYHKEMYALHPTTGRPPQQVQSCTTILSSRGAIIGAHCHPPCPGASPIVHPFQRSQEISAGFCISQHSDWICGNCTADPSRLVSQSAYNQFEKKILVVQLCEAANLFTT